MKQIFTYISFLSPLPSVNDFSAMYTLVIAIEKAKRAAVNCQNMVLMSMRILNKAIWMVPRCLDCSITQPKALSVRHTVLKL